MRSVEVTAQTLEQARRQAALELGVDEADVWLDEVECGAAREEATDVEATTFIATTPVPGHVAPTSDAVDGSSGSDGDAAISGAAGAATVAGARALTAVSEVLRLMGSDAQPILRVESSREVEIEVVGPGASALIGRHGVTLDALQLLIGIMASHGLEDGARVTLDAEGYRARRKQMLERMAHAHAAKARAARKEIVITDLKPHERRVIHLALQDDPDVETYSEGEGDERYIVISPRSSSGD